MADLTPARDDIGVLDLAEILLGFADTVLQKPGNRPKSCMDDDPNIAEDQPEDREPQMSRRWHADGRFMKDVPKPLRTDAGPQSEEGQGEEPCEGGQELR